MTKSIKILLVISGVYVIYLTIAVFQIIPYEELSWLVTFGRITFFLLEGNLYGSTFSILWNILFYVALIFAVCLSITDFLCAFYIPKGSKIFKKIAFYRSVATCLFGACVIIVGKLVFGSFKQLSWIFTIEGTFYFFFYGTIFYLLKISERNKG